MNRLSVVMRRRVEDLTLPRQYRRRGLGVHYDPDAFGNFSESIARFLGTARYLVWQTGAVAVWTVWNLVIPEAWRFDPYPFQFLTLALSLQASYAAPLILLAQNRQEGRDRQQTEIDRTVANRTQSDTEYLARELASVRLSLGDMVTNEDLREQVERVTDSLERLNRRLDALAPAPHEPRPDRPTAG